MRRELRHLRTPIALVVAIVALAGCGEEADYANDPRPPTPINVAAAITDEKITVSPKEFGAGPVVIIIANQTEQAQKVTVETDEIGGSQPGLKQSTGPINPDGTATVKVDMRRGTYRVSVGSNIEPASVTVGPPRDSAQNQLLQP